MPTDEDYEAIRSWTCQRVQIDRRTPGLRLSGIDQKAVSTIGSWPIPPRLVGWDWARLTADLRGGFLSLAIWHDDLLCGLACGRHAPTWLSLGYLEGNPSPHPLRGKVMDTALAVLETQTIALGLTEARIVNPIVDMRRWYAQRGYVDVVEEGFTVYLCKRWRSP